MIEEIYNKVSQTGSNLSDRLEDKLTGDFFGTIRYLPFELGLKHVLLTAEFSQTQVKQNWIKFIEAEQGYAAQIDFWYRDEEGEIDLLITYDKAIIGIEVKYLSGISSNDLTDGINLDYTESINQLARYSKMIERISNGRESYLLFLAPYDTMKSVKTNILDRMIIAPSVELGFMCWQDIHESLVTLNINQLETGHQLILKDLQALLIKKELIRYKGFNLSLLNQPITKTTYSFRQGEEISEHTWNWSTKIIKEDQLYVFNTLE